MRTILINHTFILVLLVNIIVSTIQHINENIRQNGGNKCECYEEFLKDYNSCGPFRSSLDKVMSFDCPYYDDEDK